MNTMNGVINQFNAAAIGYATAIQPYALKLFLALFFIDVLVTDLAGCGKTMSFPSG